MSSSSNNEIALGSLGLQEFITVQLLLCLLVVNKILVAFSLLFVNCHKLFSFPVFFDIASLFSLQKQWSMFLLAFVCLSVCL